MHRQIRFAMWLALAGGFLQSVSFAQAEPGKEVTLESLLEATRQTHPTLAKQPLLAKQRKLQINQLQRAYWPQLSLHAKATWQSDVISLDIPIPGATVSSPSKDQYGATLRLQQTIWDGGVTSDKKRLTEKMSEIEVEKVNLEWYQLRERILQLYFAGMVQQELQKQAETLAAYLGRTLEKVELSLEAGVATKRDVLIVKARRVEALQAIADAKANLDRVRKNLEILTSTKMSNGVNLAPTERKCVNPRSKAVNAADLRRPELSLLSAQADVLQAKDDLARAADRPKIGAFATAGYGRPGLNALSDSFDSYFIGGVSLSVPLTYLYTGKRRRAKEELALGRSILARQKEAVLSSVQVQLESQYAEIERLDTAISLDAQLLEFRSAARAQTELKLSGGTATMTDLIGDLTEEERVRGKNAVHSAQRDLACHQLAFIQGNL